MQPIASSGHIRPRGLPQAAASACRHRQAPADVRPDGVVEGDVDVGRLGIEVERVGVDVGHVQSPSNPSATAFQLAASGASFRDE